MHSMIQRQRFLSISALLFPLLLAVLVRPRAQAGPTAASEANVNARGGNGTVQVRHAAAHDVSPALFSLAPVQNGEQATEDESEFEMDEDEVEFPPNALAPQPAGGGAVG